MFPLVLRAKAVFLRAPRWLRRASRPRAPCAGPRLSKPGFPVGKYGAGSFLRAESRPWLTGPRRPRHSPWYAASSSSKPDLNPGGLSDCSLSAAASIRWSLFGYSWHSAIFVKYLHNLVKHLGGYDIAANVRVQTLREPPPLRFCLLVDTVNLKTTLLHGFNGLLVFFAALLLKLTTAFRRRFQHGIPLCRLKRFPALLGNDQRAYQRQPVQGQHVVR